MENAICSQGTEVIGITFRHFFWHVLLLCP